MAENYIAKASIHIRTTAPALWAAITNPYRNKLAGYSKDRQPPLEVGAQLLFKGFFEGKEYEDKGFITQFEPETVFEYSFWSVFSGTWDLPENYNLIRYELEPDSKGVELTVTQNKYATQAEAEQSSQNWAGVLAAIKNMLEQDS